MHRHGISRRPAGADISNLLPEHVHEKQIQRRLEAAKIDLMSKLLRPQACQPGERGTFDNVMADRERPRTAQSFCVPKADIVAQGYDLSINRYKEVVHEEVQHRAPKEILAELERMEEEIQAGLKRLGGMLG